MKVFTAYQFLLYTSNVLTNTRDVKYNNFVTKLAVATKNSTVTIAPPVFCQGKASSLFASINSPPEDEVFLVGHSPVGAFRAMVDAFKHKDKVSGLVLLNSCNSVPFFGPVPPSLLDIPTLMIVGSDGLNNVLVDAGKKVRENMDNYHYYYVLPKFKPDSILENDHVAPMPDMPFPSQGHWVSQDCIQ